MASSHPIPCLHLTVSTKSCSWLWEKLGSTLGRSGLHTGWAGRRLETLAEARMLRALPQHHGSVTSIYKAQQPAPSASLEEPPAPRAGVGLEAIVILSCLQSHASHPLWGERGPAHGPDETQGTLATLQTLFPPSSETPRSPLSLPRTVIFTVTAACFSGAPFPQGCGASPAPHYWVFLQF